MLNWTKDLLSSWLQRSLTSTPQLIFFYYLLTLFTDSPVVPFTGFFSKEAFRIYWCFYNFS